MTSKIIEFTPKPNLKVAKDRVITLKYALFDNETQDTLEYRDDLVYLHGGYEERLRHLQNAVEGLGAGDRTEVILSADQAFGPHDPQLVITGKAEDFPPEAQQLWTRLEGTAPDGTIVEFVVTHVENGMITVDGNHPFAGRELRFVVEVMDVRSATDEEVEKGYAIKK
jgi:FKBP-type peptidyl-prolyl cis-trans isomerase SlyD